MANAAIDNGLSKAERLKSRKQTDALFASGKSFFVHPIKVVYQLHRPDNTVTTTPVAKSSTTNHQSSIVKIGVSASKRLFKKAVDRNRIKRLLREVYRQQKHPLLATCEQKGLLMHVFFVYTHKQMPTYDELLPKMNQCLHRLQQIVNQQPSEKLLPK